MINLYQFYLIVLDGLNLIMDIGRYNSAEISCLNYEGKTLYVSSSCKGFLKQVSKRKYFIIPILISGRTRNL